MTSLPQELRQYPNWVLWKIEERDGKPTKVPYRPNGWQASSRDPETWSTFDEAVAVRDAYDGLGFVFTGTPFAGVDLDHVLHGDELDSQAAEIVTVLNSYTERSPGGDGLHVIVKGELPEGGRRKKYDGGTKEVEMYDDGRYFTMTGDHWPETSTTVEERQAQLTMVHRAVFSDNGAGHLPPPRAARPVSLDDRELIEKARNADNGSKFDALWRGDVSSYPSPSEADLALCSLLAFWTRGDEARIDRLFRQSGLMREKWDRPDYRQRTIGKAMEKTEFYDPGQQSPPPPPPSPEEDLLSRALEQEPEPEPEDQVSETELIWWDDLRRSEIPRPPDVVEGMIPGSSLVMFSGDGGIGKSYILLEMALQVAQGLPWLRMDTTSLPVLVIDLENREWRDALRVQYISAGQNLNKSNKPQVAFMLETEMSLESDEAAMGLFDVIQEFGFGLVILDSFVDFLNGLDENSNPEMATVCKRLRRIIDRTDATILCIHHVPKGSAGKQWQSSRGASALKDNADCSIQVIRSGDGTGEIMTLRHDKARDFPYKAVKCKLEWDDSWGSFRTEFFDASKASATMSGDADEQAILDSLTTEWRKRSEVTQEAMDTSGKAHTTISTVMAGLIDRGRVEEDSELFGRSTGVRIHPSGDSSNDSFGAG